MLLFLSESKLSLRSWISLSWSSLRFPRSFCLNCFFKTNCNCLVGTTWRRRYTIKFSTLFEKGGLLLLFLELLEKVVLFGWWFRGGMLLEEVVEFEESTTLGGVILVAFVGDNVV